VSPPLRREVAGLAVEHHHPDGPGPALVVVPGAMDRAAGFRRMVRHLGDREVLAYDRRGYGGSLALGAADDLVVHAADLAAVCDAVARPVVVVGHSQGGLIALTAAAGRLVPELVGLVVWEPPTPWEPGYDGSGALLDEADDPGAVAERFLRTVLGERLWDRVPERTKAERRAEGPALVADLRSSRRPGAAPDLAAVGVPTLVGRGSESGPHHRRAAEVVATGVADGHLVEVAGVGHGPHLSAPAAFADFVLDADTWIATRRAELDRRPGPGPVPGSP